MNDWLVPEDVTQKLIKNLLTVKNIFSLPDPNVVEEEVLEFIKSESVANKIAGGTDNLNTPTTKRNNQNKSENKSSNFFK